MVLPIFFNIKNTYLLILNYHYNLTLMNINQYLIFPISILYFPMAFLYLYLFPFILTYGLRIFLCRVGREDASSRQDIVLSGHFIKDEHCIFTSSTNASGEGTVVLEPCEGTETYVNGKRVTEPTVLRSGSSLVSRLKTDSVWWTTLFWCL